MLVFTFQQIADAVPSMLTQSDTDAGSWELDDDCWPTLLDRVEDYFGNTAPGMDRELASRGFIIDHDAKTITVAHADAMTGACRLIREITWEYDCTKDRADVPTSWWSSLPLGGDDDVDYNGSYLDIALDPLCTLLPDDYQPRIEPDAPVYEDYHLPADVIEANLAAYREQFYKDNPEALVRDTLRARVHDIVKLTYPTDGLVLNVDEFQLYHVVDGQCTVYRSPRADNGPWVFTAEGCEDITIGEAE